MFIQHQQNIPELSNSDKIVTNEFELVINDKSSDLVHCTIYFEYLSAHFECAVLLTPNSILLSSLNPFKGIMTIAPLVTATNLGDQKYISRRDNYQKWKPKYCLANARCDSVV